ncbi:comF family protein [Bacteroidales bacterium KA00344]|nr:comF family protein [Bacteroidales bacterium KA00344]
MRISFLQRVFDLIAPRLCCICGSRLAPEEDAICVSCNLRLPRTDHLLQPYDNALAKTFWGRIKHMEKAAAMYYHHGGSQASYPIYNLKYDHRPEIGTALGRLMALEMENAHFFNDIDVLIPVPLSADRQRERGYNQSEIIAKGMAEICGKPVLTNVLERREYRGSQTQKGRWERNENVENAFFLLNGNKIKNSHILLVDDVVTTGATICACAKQLEQVAGVKISVATIGFADLKR